jgi:putative transposase
MGLLLAVVITAANVQDRLGARLLAARLSERFPRLAVLFADAGYRSGPLAAYLLALGGWILEIVQGLAGQRGFSVVPKRWIVEHTFGWLGRYRRLSKDYEELPETSEAFIYIAMIHLMLQRLR